MTRAADIKLNRGRGETDVALPGKTIGEQLAHLELIKPNRATNGFLYADASDKKQRWTKANLYLYIRSSEGTYSVHETEFQYTEGRTPDEWARWFRENAFKGAKKEGRPFETLGIIKGAIIPGVNDKTQLQWKVASFLGFTTFDLQKPVHAALRAKRHKAKSSGKSNGQNHLRRGHRNRKRKAK